MDYGPGNGMRVRANGPDRLCVLGDATDGEALRTVLLAWLRGRAGKVLPAMLREEGRRIGLLPRRIQVRNQKTRWGSCSARGTISLNARLLFMPEELGRYVLVHELCHLAQLNHSRDYWREVARHAPGHHEREADLRSAWRFVPVLLR